MNLYKKVIVFTFSIAILLILFIHAQASLNSTTSDDIDKLDLYSAEDLNDNDIKNIMHKIDFRVKQVKNNINQNFYMDHYDGDILMFRYFDTGDLQESYTTYYLYYNKQGRIIYAEIAHYRGALYSIYFHNDELFHVEVGPFVEDGLSINGNMADVETVIEKDPSYTFVREDSSFCLDNAYK